MTDNYTPIRELTDKLLLEYYKWIEKDLEEIVNAPSTINSIFKYYRVVGWQSDSDHYLMFNYNGEWIPVREYKIDDFLRRISFEKSLKYMCDVGLNVNLPKAIMFQGGYK